MRSLHTIIDAFLKNMEMKNQVGLAQTIFTHFSCPSQQLNMTQKHWKG